LGAAAPTALRPALPPPPPPSRRPPPSSAATPRRWLARRWLLVSLTVLVLRRRAEAWAAQLVYLRAASSLARARLGSPRRAP
jgi:hypothetical protein